VIKALVFDAYGTLFDVYSVSALCEELFPGHGSALAALWRAKQLQYSLLGAMMNRYRDFWRVTEDGLVFAARSLQLDLTDSTRARLLDAYLTLSAFPDARPGLEALRRAGLRLAILSNGSPAMLAAAVESAGMTSLLDAVLSVDQVRTFKPSPQVYGLIESTMGLAAQETGFVSSNSWDVHGAGSAGLTTFWLQRSTADASEELGYPAAHVVHALTELLPLVRAAL
jgi:2-haloacid dehalogenase